MAAQGGQLAAHIQAIVVVQNARSTRSARAEKLIAGLRRAVPDMPVRVVSINDDSDSANRKKLLDELHKAPAGQSLVVVAGGDGTAHFAANALLHPNTPAKLRDTPLAAWPLGNGNDFFHSIHGAAAARDPLQAIFGADLRSVRIFPLEWHITDNNGAKRREISLCYGTVGATASVTDTLNEPTHRRRRRSFRGLGSLLFDIYEGSRAMWFPKQFSVEEGTDAVYRAIELQFNNGPLMTMRARYPVLLSDHAMFFSRTTRNDPFTIGAQAVRMGLGSLPGRHCTECLSFHLRSNGPIHAQTDGESFTMPAEVSFTIGPSEQSLVVWASKPA